MKNPNETTKLLGGLLAFFLIYVIFSLSTYKDFGITADEELEYLAGKALISYYKTGEDPTDLGLANRHLPSQTLYFRIYPALVSLINSKGYYEWAHLINMAFGFLIVPITALFGFLRYKKAWTALVIGVSMILLPRFFGDIPANPKDIPFAILYFATLTFIYYAFENNQKIVLKVVVAGFLLAVLQSMRSIGFLLHIVLFIRLLTANISKMRALAVSVWAGFISIGFMYLFWPFIQTNFPTNLFNLFTGVTKYQFWNNYILYQGEYLTKFERPWHYLFVWIAITTPLFILITYLLSISQIKNKVYLFLHLTIFINSLAYLILKPYVYNSIRHFLFLLPIMVTLGWFFIFDILLKTKFKLPISAIVASNILIVLITMKNLHPYEYLYFNELVGGIKGAQKKYELDYWGASYKEASEYLRSEITDPKTKVYPCDLSYAVLYYAQGKFEIAKKKAEADYIICDADNDRLSQLSYPVLHNVSRLDTTINIIRKIE